MTADEFRSLALSLPEAEERAHMGHPDFRVRNKIFATLWPDDDWGMVKLTREQQATWLRLEPKTFTSVKGAWGARGATHVQLAPAPEDAVRRALVMAWRNTAPKRLAQQLDEE